MAIGYISFSFPFLFAVSFSFAFSFAVSLAFSISSHLLVLVFTSNERMMGAFKNHIVVSIITWSLGLFAMGANVYLIYAFTRAFSSSVHHEGC